MESQETMFASQATNSEVQSRGLYKTAELTQLSATLAKDALKVILNDETYRSAILASQKSNDAMDDLLRKVVAFETEYAFLNGVAATEIEKMLKSQQSKRSRTKSMAMTLENYTTLMTAGVAENILRIAGNNPKGVSTASSRKSSVGYTDEELQALANDQDALAKAIRNVQSKKCIAKSKAGFNADTDDYKQILSTEELLKSLRTNAVPVPQEVIINAEQATTAKEVLAEVEDIEKLNAKDSKALLQKIQEALGMNI